MSVWLCIPSARPPTEAEKCLAKWRKQGYKVALWRDNADGISQIGDGWEILHIGKYPGYAQAVNSLIATVMDNHPDAEWFVTGGDDVEPDMHHTAEEIAAQCREYFGSVPRLTNLAMQAGESFETFGVMQPTGDRFAGGSIYRICGSPWMGREFCKRINRGKGPLWPEYTHMFVDEELQNVAIKYGILWQRRDLIHLHHHFTRHGSIAVSTPPPEHLVKWNTREHWDASKAIFTARKAAGFPGSGPL
jgi:hypothetical protein